MSDDVVSATAEGQRLAEADAGAVPWRLWGPYLAERAWGTVREDYSEYGEAWSYFPHDHARSRAYRWNEDGMAGLCDERQNFCFALALWNGNDPILKERMYGLDGNTGNHGEDVKEYWWYEDSTPTHSYMRWRYHYPQAAYPYQRINDENAKRDRSVGEYELVDTGVFDDDRYWAVTVEYGKADPTDMCMVVTVANRGPEEATLHVLPTLWFRNNWAWGLPDHPEPRITTGGTETERLAGHLRGGASLVARHHLAGRIALTGDGEPTALACDNETNAPKLWGAEGRSRYPKDGINDHVVHGADTVNPDGTGTKAALWYRLTVPAGGEATIRLRLATGHAETDVAAVVAVRRREADAYFAALMPAGTTDGEAAVARAAIAGLMWGKQYYHFDVDRWLAGDSTAAPPPAERLHGRDSAWWHVHAADVISMPDPWEYPWFAAWDLAFQCVALARVDPGFAKSQLLLLLRDWYLHPDGQIPAYEWAFGDVNPPVHAWAALRVFEIDGGRDYDFLARVMHKLLLNFTWWVNRKDFDGNNVFEGGFLGLDNVGPFDRSAALPVAGELEQSDGTGWMAMYALNMLEMALLLARHDLAYEDIATKFFEHFAYIGAAAKQLWSEADGFFCDQLRTEGADPIPMRVFSVVGLIPMCATASLEADLLSGLPDLAARVDWFLTHKPEYATVVGEHRGDERLLSVATPDQLVAMLRRALDEAEFLSPYGLRSLSRYHLDHPFVVDLGGHEFSVDYEPAESRTSTFGGNSNWRGPVWTPVNFLIVGALREFGAYLGSDTRVECPTGSGHMLTLDEAADALSARLVAAFLPGPDGRRPIYRDHDLLATHPDWKDRLLFPEYFHGDTGAGLGASHQTGWTALVASLILSRGGNHPTRLR